MLLPKTKIKERMSTYEQFFEIGRKQGLLESKFEGKLQMLYKAWRKGFSMAIMIELFDLPKTTIELWIERFKTLQKYRLAQKTADDTAKAVQLTEQEVKDWWIFFDKAEQKNKN